MIKKMVLGLLVVGLSSSCVSKKIYTDLENKYAALKREQRKMSENNEALQKEKNQLALDKDKLSADLAQLRADRDKLQAEYTAAGNNLKSLQDAYAALEKNSGQELQNNLRQNRELLAQLEAKGKALAAEQERLNKFKSDLQASSTRLAELESMIAAKDASMRKLRETLSRALNNFEGKGLTVEQKNGKVYVSMENKLLFSSGSWAVGTEGRRAVVEVGKVLADNPEISVLIEGHTDDVPYAGTGVITNNWDLSTKRATAIVNILAENKSINPQNLTAAGRSEFAPIAPNTSSDGKAKNRRIEIILTPKLDEISKMLEQI